MRRQIIHVDMDEFFAAVEKLDRPELCGKPLLIGGDPAGRGVVSTASYEARPFGCRSAMPMAAALRLCPHAVVLPVRGRRYGEISRRVFEVFRRFTPMVEPLSIDEAFLDVTGCEALFGPAPEIARTIKGTIRTEIGLTASVGVAPNKFLAKLASDLRKPDGLVVITPETMRQTLDPIPVGRLWGVGPAAAARLERLGIRTIGDLVGTPRATVRQFIGSQADHLLDLASGIDDRAVVPTRDPKSMGQEQTFSVDVDDLERLRSVLLGQVEDVGRRLREHGLEARTVTVKLRYGDFTTRTRGMTLPEPTDATAELWEAAASLLAAWAETQFRPLRLLGFTASNVRAVETGPGALFTDPGHVRHVKLDKAMDEIAGRFGPGAVRRGGSRRRGEE